MKLTQIVKRAAGHYTARTAAGTFTITRTGRTWHLVGRRITAVYRTLRAAVAALKAHRPTPLGGMPTRLTKNIAHTHQAARTTSKALKYRCLSGDIAVAVDNGTLIRVSTYLTALGLDDEFIDRYGSPFGKHAVKAHRADGRGEPVRVWICNTRGRYVRVFAYQPGDQALHAAVASYARTRHLVQSDLAEAA